MDDKIEKISWRTRKNLDLFVKQMKPIINETDYTIYLDKEEKFRMMGRTIGSRPQPGDHTERVISNVDNEARNRAVNLEQDVQKIVETQKLIRTLMKEPEVRRTLLYQPENLSPQYYMKDNSADIPESLLSIEESINQLKEQHSIRSFYQEIMRRMEEIKYLKRNKNPKDSQEETDNLERLLEKIPTYDKNSRITYRLLSRYLPTFEIEGKKVVMLSTNYKENQPLNRWTETTEMNLKDNESLNEVLSFMGIEGYKRAKLMPSITQEFEYKEDYPCSLKEKFSLTIQYEDEQGKHEVTKTDDISLNRKNIRRKWKNDLSNYRERFSLGELFLMSEFEFYKEDLEEDRKYNPRDLSSSSKGKFIKKYQELSRLAGIAEYFVNIRAQGYDLCFPEITTEPGDFEAQELINPNLIGRKPIEEIISNDITMNQDNSVIILTGSNNNGKSTFAEGITINQLLGQAGFPVFARKAKMGIKQGIRDLYIEPGDIARGESRQIKELNKVNELLDELSKNYLIFLDEIYTGTDPKEGQEALEEFVEAMSSLGIPTMISTHYLETAKKVQEIPNVRIYKFEARVEGEEVHPNYRAEIGVSKTSHGLLYLRKYGLTKEQIVEKVNKQNQKNSEEVE